MTDAETLERALENADRELAAATERLADAVVAGRDYSAEMAAVRVARSRRRRVLLALEGVDCPECEGRGASDCPCCEGWGKVLPNEALRWSDRATEPDPDEAYDRRWL